MKTASPALPGLNEPIDFFADEDPFFELSNYYPCEFELDGLSWPTVEHYFQAMKFPGAQNETYRERIRSEWDPQGAKALGQTRDIPLRSDWEDVKEQVMLKGLREKFSDPRLRDVLLGTGDRSLREASPQDSYWGIGPDGMGRNRLGYLLEQVREELRLRSWLPQHNG